MLKIEYPEHNFRIKKEKNKQLIFDEVRRTWVTLTPEEWVRQNFLQYLIRVKNYPQSLCAVEKMVKLGELKKRCDIVVYKDNLPWMIIECKEMNADLRSPVLEQVLYYNIAIPVRYLVITNGKVSFAYELSLNTAAEVKDLPSF
jgi:hypothetical protein